MCYVIAVSTLFGQRSLHSIRELDHILDKEVAYFILLINARNIMQRKRDMKSWKRCGEIRVTV